MSGPVVLRLSPELHSNALGEMLRTAAEGHVKLESIEDLDGREPLPWALVEADFNYVSQWTVATAKDPFAPMGSRSAAVLCFTSATADVQKVMEDLQRWWPATSERYPGARMFVVLVGQKVASLNSEAAQLVAEVLITLGWNTVEVRTPQQAATYAVNCAEAVLKSRGRTLPSRFKVQGVRCQTVPKDPDDRLANTWVSQLMQVQGMSEDIAKVVAERFNSPCAMMEAVSLAAAAAVEGKEGDTADRFLSDLELPIRGKKGTRRLGPVLSRRLFTLFHPYASSDQLIA